MQCMQVTHWSLNLKDCIWCPTLVKLRASHHYHHHCSWSIHGRTGHGNQWSLRKDTTAHGSRKLVFRSWHCNASCKGCQTVFAFVFVITKLAGVSYSSMDTKLYSRWSVVWSRSWYQIWFCRSACDTPIEEPCLIARWDWRCINSFMATSDPWTGFVLRRHPSERSGDVCTVIRPEGSYSIPTCSNSVNLLCKNLYDYGLASQDDLIETPDGILLKSHNEPSGPVHLCASANGRDSALKQLFPQGNVSVSIRRKPWLQGPRAAIIGEYCYIRIETTIVLFLCFLTSALIWENILEIFHGPRSLPHWPQTTILDSLNFECCSCLLQHPI